MADVFADERPFSDQEFDAFLDNVSCVLDTNSGYETMAFPEDCVGLEAPMSASLHATSSHKVLTGADLSDTARGYLSCESLLDDSILHLPQVPSIVIDTTPAATARHGSQQAHGQSLNGSRDPYLEQTPQDGAAGTQSGAHKPAKRSLESSRKAQRRYRARQKVSRHLVTPVAPQWSGLVQTAKPCHIVRCDTHACICCPVPWFAGSSAATTRGVGQRQSYHSKAAIRNRLCKVSGFGYICTASSVPADTTDTEHSIPGKFSKSCYQQFHSAHSTSAVQRA